ATIRRLFAEVMERFEAGDYRAERFTTFPAEQTIDAFRYMSQRKNIGKVVVQFAPQDTEGPGLKHQQSAVVRRDGSYLITGGLGALGLQLARWLADQGAGGLVLMARSAPSAEKLELLRTIEE